ncbi:MAG: AraC family transcriptional regulator [Pseudomonas sp.]|uniref:AraC family transcriptional regulator n=1 Tax=Pseudomonas sp. TaxID=306 RepID=UPI003BB6A477
MSDKAPNHWPLRRSGISAQLLTQFGLDQGLSVERCLAGTGLSLQQLAEPGGEIDAAQELALIGNLVAALGAQPGIGLKAGQRYHLSTYGIWGFAMLSSPTFRSAASLGLRYLDLTYAFYGMRLEEHGAEVHLVFEDRGIPAELRAFILERDSAGMLGIQRDLLGQHLPLSRVDLSLPRPADCSWYTDSYGIEPRFAQAENRFVLRQELLDQPLPGANPQVAQHCEEQCHALLTKRRERSGLAGQIRARLLGSPGRLPGMQEVAQQFNLSSRTLRRRLLDEGSSFRQLLEEVRQTLAEELLAIGGLTLEEIAERLGYAEVSNFIHAFKRWKGLPPHQYRQRRRGAF